MCSAEVSRDDFQSVLTDLSYRDLDAEHLVTMIAGANALFQQDSVLHSIVRG